MVSAGAGILTITDKYMEQFNLLLLDYYNTGNDAELKQFLYDNAIHGIKFWKGGEIASIPKQWTQ